MKARAAVLYEPRQPLRVEEVDLGPVKEADVLVRLVATGVCHSDLHVYQGQPGWPMPMVLGHEAAGVVEGVGAAVTMVRPGDHVVISVAPYCGRCRQCVRGRTHRCRNLRSGPGLLYDGETRLSREGQPIHHFANCGTYATHMIVHETCAVPIDRDLPLDRACLVGCALPTGLGAVLNTARVEPGSSVVVIGCGGVGLNVVQGARLAGAAQIIAVDLLESKLALARTFGATHVIDASMEDARERVREITGEEGADYAFEVIGRIDTILDAYEMVGRGGKAIVIGMGPDDEPVPVMPRTLLQEKTLTGTQYGSTTALRDFPYYLALYRDGRLKIDELITGYRTLDEINEAFEDLERGRAIRTVLRLE